MIPSTAFTPDTEGVFSIPQETYFAAPGVSNSMLSHIIPPARLREYLDNPEDRETTAAMILGTLIHSSILEPDRPLPRIAVKPHKMSFTTREGKAWRDEREAAGMMILTHEDGQALVECVKAAARHPYVQDLLGPGSLTEVSIFGSPNGTTLRKARIDIVPPGNVLADIKTVANASPEAFAKMLADNGYARQAAWYLELWNHLVPDDQKEVFLFIAIEKTPPYLVAVYQVSRETLFRAREANEHRLAMYRECCESGEWPGYPTEPQLIDLPRWAKP